MARIVCFSALGESPWRSSNRFDPPAVKIADRHYNRQKPGTNQFVPPGACLVFKTAEALWTSSWPKAEFTKHAWAGAWMNTLFRREGGTTVASEMILHAVSHTRYLWGQPPSLGMVTFVDASKVKSTNPGYCYVQAGFKKVGTTKGGLLAFQLLPDDMPEPTPVPTDQLAFAVA